ncbi:MAG: alpha/beta hydrolase [Xenococcaceae cyanobacterium MO_188.B29]|nr:alpha/beta hydrolase [Xenococcaceae cyanobacterium MO_188.B29]
MICKEGTFLGTNQFNLYYQSWNPDKKIKGVVVIVHGLGGHSGKYANIVSHLVDRGFAIYSFDQRGNGRSPGQRGYINSWTELRSDLATFIRLVKTETKDYPCFLLGHSLGAAVVLDYGLRAENPQSHLQGIVAMAPALGAVGVPPWRLFLGRVLSQIYPRFSLDLGIDLSASSRDPQVIEAYKQDTLRHTRGTARLSTEFTQTLAWINNHIQEWQLPILILYGGEDRVTLPQSNYRFFESITFADKEIKEYPESYHELQSDLNYKEVLEDLEDWLERHLA